MLSGKKIKFLTSLSYKKYRDTSVMFLAEGDKIVKDILNSAQSFLQAEELFATQEFISANRLTAFPSSLKVSIISDHELRKISQLSTPNKAVLLVKIPEYAPDPIQIANSYSLVFEDISDPGNLGTIIRTADWFGIRDIFCSPGSVDVYNQKVIQSTMGAVCRVRVHYTPLSALLTLYRNDYKTEITGTLLDGCNLDTTELQIKNGMIVFGNESRGISSALRKCLNKEVKIPSFHDESGTSGSLNVASAAAIMCWEIRRRTAIIQNEN